MNTNNNYNNFDLELIDNINPLPYENPQNVITTQPNGVKENKSKFAKAFDELKKYTQYDVTAFGISVTPKAVHLTERLNNIPQTNKDVPINEANILMAHNAESSVAYGAIRTT